MLSLALQLLFNLSRYETPHPQNAASRETKVVGDATNYRGVPHDTTTVGETIVYGHLHMQKTAGSNINGMMATKYDNVCGNKGSSYNAFVVNQERQEAITNMENGNRAEVSFGRKGVPYNEVRDTIGFANCDYISVETKWKNWKQDIVDALDFEKRSMRLELHVPCRDHLDHLLSLCNHRNKKFQCPDISDEDAIASEIKKCLWAGPKKEAKEDKVSNILINNARFDPKLRDESHSKGIDLKCFSTFPVENYINYMGQFMRKRRIEAPFVDRKTNKDREKTTECLLDQDDNYKATVKRLVLQLDFMGYYQFCEDCMGSSDQLKLS